MAGKLVLSAVSTPAGVVCSAVARKLTRAGVSLVTADSGSASSRAVACGKFLVSAATTADCGRPVCLDTKAMSAGTSAAPPPCGLTAGAAKSTTCETMVTPASSPWTRVALKAGLAWSSRFCAPSRRGKNDSTSTTTTSAAPTAVTRDQPAAAISLGSVLRANSAMATPKMITTMPTVSSSGARNETPPSLDSASKWVR